MTDQTTQEGPDLEAVTAAARVALDDIRKAWGQIRDAALDLWRGPVGQALRRREAMLRARRAHREDGYRDPYTDDRPPSGCAICGRPERSHGRIWHRSEQRYSLHVRPDQSTILARMQVRRADRLNRSTTR